MNQKPVYLTAAWINLVNITWQVEPSLLLPHLPKGTELETENGKAFVSLVPFRFDEVKLRGWKIPFHRSFPEMNLRFYVHHKGKRGVVFIREFVPRFFVAFIARRVYNEPYVCVPMKEKTILTSEKIIIRHDMRIGGADYFFEAEGFNKPFLPESSSTEHRFKEMMYGYGKQRDGSTLIYEVEHPAWEAYPMLSWKTNLDFGKVYGNEWAFLATEKPFHEMIAKGSPIVVRDFSPLE